MDPPLALHGHVGPEAPTGVLRAVDPPTGRLNRRADPLVQGRQPGVVLHERDPHAAAVAEVGVTPNQGPQRLERSRRREGPGYRRLGGLRGHIEAQERHVERPVPLPEALPDSRGLNEGDDNEGMESLVGAAHIP